jgi:glycogen operon protein
VGATPRDGGISFAVASSVAEPAEVCLFDEAGHQDRFRLPDARAIRGEVSFGPEVYD